MWGFGDSLLGVKAKAEPPKQLLPERLRPAAQGWGAQPGGARRPGGGCVATLARCFSRARTDSLAQTRAADSVTPLLFLEAAF